MRWVWGFGSTVRGEPTFVDQTLIVDIDDINARK
jgi:hypothetical protein